jgi:hypothetical protein
MRDQVRPSPIELTIVAASYQNYRSVHVLIHSLLCQTLQNWLLLLVHDGPDPRMRAEVARYVESNPRIDMLETPARHNDFGHSPRAYGLERASSEFVMFTNDDNYYVPKFTEYMFQRIRRENLDLVLCNMIHSHRNPGRIRRDDYHVFDSVPKKWRVDIGNFIIRRSMALEVGFDSRAYDADGVFIEKVISSYNVESRIPGWTCERPHVPARKTIRIGKEERVLYVHN